MVRMDGRIIGYRFAINFLCSMYLGAEFAGMKLGGIILISVGFFLVMFPNNWPDYITRLLRFVEHQQQCDFMICFPLPSIKFVK